MDFGNVFIRQMGGREGLRADLSRAGGAGRDTNGTAPVNGTEAANIRYNAWQFR